MSSYLGCPNLNSNHIEDYMVACQAMSGLISCPKNLYFVRKQLENFVTIQESLLSLWWHWRLLQKVMQVSLKTVYQVHYWWKWSSHNHLDSSQSNLPTRHPRMLWWRVETGRSLCQSWKSLCQIAFLSFRPHSRATCCTISLNRRQPEDFVSECKETSSSSVYKCAIFCFWQTSLPLAIHLNLTYSVLVRVKLDPHCFTLATFKNLLWTFLSW